MTKTPTIEFGRDGRNPAAGRSAGEGAPWRQWGPYFSERQWGTVREDYSSAGNAWAHFYPSAPQQDQRASGLMWIKVPIPQPAEIHLNCGRTTMNKPAVLDNSNEKIGRSAIRMGKLVVNLDTRIGSVDDRVVHQYNLLERT